MDFRYAGSASYPRFDRELCAIAEVFGGIKTEHLKERQATEDERPLGYWFGFLSSDTSDEDKFVFPEGTNELIVRWFNHIYDDYSAIETKNIAELVFKHPEIRDISSQIWRELEMLTECRNGWRLT